MTDVGAWLVDNLYRQLVVDDEWSVRRERGFTWWSYRLAQHVEVAPPVHDDGLDLCTVRIWTDVVVDVDPASDPAAILTQLNYQTTLNALVWNPLDAAISECCTVTVHQDNADWMSKVLATAAVLQSAGAHNRAQALAQACGGRPAQTQHPGSGIRPSMDEILNVPAAVIAPMGQEPSKFVGEPCLSIEPFLVELSSVKGWFGTVDAAGATVEVPFGGATALVQVITDAPHPAAGNGALVITRLPLSPGTEQAVVLANDLNRAEADGGLTAPPLLGSWCPDFLSKDGNGLAFCTFLPNLLAGPHILKNWVLYQSTRAAWSREFLGM